MKLSETFIKSYRCRPLTALSGNALAVEDANMVKLALKYSDGLDKDTLACCLKHIVTEIGTQVAAGHKVQLDFAVGTLLADSGSVRMNFRPDAVQRKPPLPRAPPDAQPRPGTAPGGFAPVKHAADPRAAAAAAADQACNAAAAAGETGRTAVCGTHAGTAAAVDAGAASARCAQPDEAAPTSIVKWQARRPATSGEHGRRAWAAASAGNDRPTATSAERCCDGPHLQRRGECRPSGRPGSSAGKAVALPAFSSHCARSAPDVPLEDVQQLFNVAKARTTVRRPVPRRPEPSLPRAAESERADAPASKPNPHAHTAPDATPHDTRPPGAAAHVELPAGGANGREPAVSGAPPPEDAFAPATWKSKRLLHAVFAEEQRRCDDNILRRVGARVPDAPRLPTHRPDPQVLKLSLDGPGGGRSGRGRRPESRAGLCERAIWSAEQRHGAQVEAETRYNCLLQLSIDDRRRALDKQAEELVRSKQRGRARLAEELLRQMDAREQRQRVDRAARTAPYDVSRAIPTREEGAAQLQLRARAERQRQDLEVQIKERLVASAQRRAEERRLELDALRDTERQQLHDFLRKRREHQQHVLDHARDWAQQMACPG